MKVWQSIIVTCFCLILAGGIAFSNPQEKSTPRMSSDDLLSRGSARNVKSADEGEEQPKDRLKSGDDIKLVPTSTSDSVLVFANEQTIQDTWAEGEDRRDGLIAQMIA